MFRKIALALHLGVGYPHIDPFVVDMINDELKGKDGAAPRHDSNVHTLETAPAENQVRKEAA